MSSALRVEAVDFFVHRTRTRFPFRYGIASMTEVPHLFVRVRIAMDGGVGVGIASEGLPPKWFTKDPSTTFAEDLPAMYGVIGHAAQVARSLGRLGSYFEWWQGLQSGQEAWGRARGHPGLLTGLGTSLLERAVLDALCRRWGIPLHRAVSENRLGLRLGEVHAALGETEPRDWLPPRPREEVLVRHTLGLGDALTSGDLAPGERVDDGLPQTLEESARYYRLSAFKIKLSGKPDRDVARLEAVDRVLASIGTTDYLVTLDGNENFLDFGSFRDFWETLTGASSLRDFRTRIAFVEQPVHRNHALSDEAGEVLGRWSGRPPLVLDESDGRVADLERGLELGYAGTSHKNCKGLVKGVAHACWLSRRRREGLPSVLSGEDLCNLGPVALLQDLALMALLGLAHVERNGHHYFRGLSPWPAEWQELTRMHHPDLYVEDPPRLTRLAVVDGRVRLGSVNEAPLGVRPWLDPERVGLARVTLDENGLVPAGR